MRRITFSLVLALTMGTAFAQSNPTFTPSARASGVAAGSFDRVEAGYLTDDHYVDVVFLAGGTLHMAMSIEAWDAAQDLGIAAADFAVVSGASPHGLDAIAYSDAFGMHWLYFDPSTGDFAAPENFPAPRVGNALRIRAADVDGDGAQDLTALSFDGLRVYDYDNVASKPTPTIRFLTGGIAFDIVLANYDGLGDLDLIALRGDAVSSVDSSGTLVTLSAIPGQTRGIAAFFDSSMLTDRIAVIAESGGLDTLYLVDDSVSPMQTIGLSTGAASNVTSGDLDDDGEDDLIISHGMTHEVLALFNKPGTNVQSFVDNTTHAAWLPLVVDDPDTQVNEVDLAQPVGAAGYMHALDVDHDGDLEVVAGVDSTPALALLSTSDVVDQAEMRPTAPIGPQIIEYDNLSEIVYYYHAFFDERALFDPSWTDLEIITRRRLNFLASESAIAQVHHRDFFAIDTANPNGTKAYIHHEASNLEAVDYPFVARFVSRDGLGKITDAGPCVSMTFAPSPTAADQIAGGPFLANNFPRKYWLNGALLISGIVDQEGRLGSGDTPVDPPACVEEPLPTGGSGGGSPPPPNGGTTGP